MYILSDCFCSLCLPLQPSVQAYIFSSVVFFLFCCCCQKSIGPPAGRLGVRAHITYKNERSLWKRGKNNTNSMGARSNQWTDERENNYSVCTQNVGWRWRRITDETPFVGPQRCTSHVV